MKIQLIKTRIKLREFKNFEIKEKHEGHNTQQGSGMANKLIVIPCV